jgi:hypothetical protein
MGLAQKRFTGKKGFICFIVFVLLVSCSFFLLLVVCFYWNVLLYKMQSWKLFGLWEGDRLKY